MIDPSTKISIPDHVESTVDGENVVILNFESGEFYGLIAVGKSFWELVNRKKNGIAIEQILRDLMKEYDVGEDQLRGDILALITELSKNGVLDILND